MPKLNDILRKYTTIPSSSGPSDELGNDELGGDQSEQAKRNNKPPLDKKVAESELAAALKEYDRCMLMVKIVIMAIFAVVFIVILRSPHDVRIQGGAFAFMGASGAGLLKWMMALARERRDTRMVLRLSQSMEPNAAQFVIDAVFRLNNTKKQ